MLGQGLRASGISGRARETGPMQPADDPSSSDFLVNLLRPDVILGTHLKALVGRFLFGGNTLG